MLPHLILAKIKYQYEAINLEITDIQKEEK